MKRQMTILLMVGILAGAAASCATTNTWGTTNPPIAVVEVLNFTTSTDIGITTEIGFSVKNVTERELTDLTLTVTTNPSGGVDLPFKEMTIDRIEPNGTWAPREPFLVRGRRSGTTAVFFTVTQDGRFLARDYALVGVNPEDMTRTPFMSP